MTQYTKMQIAEGTAYVQNQFVDNVVAANVSSHIPFQLSDFVIGLDGKIVKCRYFLPEVIECYIIVASSPFLSKLVDTYGKAKQIISRF